MKAQKNRLTQNASLNNKADISLALTNMTFLTT